MASPPTCGQCGTSLPGDGPPGICPRCVLKGALELSSSLDEALGEPAAQFPPRIRYVGDYELLEEIGRGAMGVVSKARQCSLNRIVAVKIVAGGALARPEAVERFRREAEAVAQLHHPGIVAIHEIGEHEGCHYFSMDFVQGAHLELSKQGEPLPGRKAADYIRKVAEAVHYAHTHASGIIHRDLKPANILIDENDQPRVTDFGLARGLADTANLTQTGQMLGSPPFMPPEQASRKFGKVGTWSDVYSLGAVLYYLVTARPPFLAATPEETVHSLLTTDPVPPRVLIPAVPKDLETICLKCLEKDSARRYKSAQALAEDLQRFLHNEPIQARPVTRPERFWRWCQRQPGVALPSALAVILLIATALISTVSAVRVTNARNRAQAQQARAEARETEGHQRLAGLKVSQGWQLAERGDLLASLAPFAEALLLETNDPARVEAHRYRIASILQEAPQIVRMWFPGGPVKHIELSPDGRWLLTAINSLNGTTNAAAQVWDTQTGQPVSAPMLHAGAVHHAAFSPDGCLIVTASADKSARVWDAATGRPISPPVFHIAAVVHASFSPDGERVVSGTSSWPQTNGSFVVWHARTGGILCTQQIRGMDVLWTMFDPAGTNVIIGSRTYLCNFFDARTGRKMANLPTWEAHALRYSPDGRSLAVAGTFGEQRQPGARIFDVVRLNPVAPLLAHEHGPALAIAFNPDGRLVATGGMDQRVGLWDLATGEKLGGDFRHQGPVDSVEFSPVSPFLVTASSDHTARVWDGDCHELAVPPLRHAGAVSRAVFTTDGQRVVTGSADGAVRVWRLWPQSAPCRTTRVRTELTLARYGPDGHRIATGERDGAVRFWNSEDGTQDGPPLQHPDAIKQVTFSSDGTKVLTLAGAYELGFVRVWPLQHPARLPPQIGRATTTARFSPDSRQLATADRNGPSALFDAATGQPVPGVVNTWLRSARSDALTGIRFSPDGRRLVTAQKTGWAFIWDLSAQQRLAGPLEHDGELHDVCFSPDGQWIATACRDSSARLWPVTGEPPASPPLRHIAPVRRVVFSPNGRQLLSWGDDPTARVWEVPSGQSVCPPLTHRASITEAAFSPNGRLIATASLDGTARVWDATTGEPLTPPLHHGGAVRTVEFHPSGARLLTAAADQTFRQWNLPSSRQPAAELAELAALLSGERVAGIAISLRELWERHGRQAHLLSNSTLAAAYGDELGRLLRAAAQAEKDAAWPRTVALLGRVLELSPSDWDMRFRRACARLRLRQWEQAADDFTAAFDRYTNAAACVLGRSFARGQAGDLAGASGDLRIALGLAQGFREGPWQPASGTRPDPSSPAHWHRLRELASAALLVDSNDVPALAVRGVIEGIGSDWYSASLTFGDAISNQTNDATLRLGRALAGRNLEFWTRLIPAGDSVIRRTPQDPLPWAVRGEAHFQLGRMTNAVTDLERAVALGLDTPGLRLLLTDAEIALRRWPRAVTHALRAVELDPTHHSATHKAVWLLANGPGEIRNADQALSIARQAVEQLPDHPAPLLDLGLALYRMKDLAEAISHLEAAERLPGGKSSPCLFLLALSQHRLGQPEKAAGYFRRALKQQPTDTPKYLGLAGLAGEAQQTLALPSAP